MDAAADRPCGIKTNDSNEYDGLVALHPGQTVVTKRLEVDFEAPALPGELIASVTVRTLGARHATVEASLKNSEDLVVARARAELNVTSSAQR